MTWGRAWRSVERAGAGLCEYRYHFGLEGAGNDDSPSAGAGRYDHRPRHAVEAVKIREVDLALVAIDPVCAGDTDCTAAYVTIEGAHLVRNTSALSRNDEVDRPGS